MLDKVLRFMITVLAAIGGLMMTDRIIPYLASVVSPEFLSLGFFGITAATILSFIVGGLLGGLLGFLLSPLLVRRLWQFT